jgi:hydroxymethylbilane synthase
LLARRPDLNIVPLRGNVQTRLDKLAAGQVDATFLAMAGLNRLGITGDYIYPVEYEEMLPSCGQGIIGIEQREDDDRVRKLLDPIHHKDTGICAQIERAALQVLDGSCHTPIGAYARRTGKMFRFNLKLASTDGKMVFNNNGITYINTDFEAAEFGADVARKIREEAPDVMLQ